MFLQGNLQVVFDALYAIGVIDPVLKQDWSKVNAQMVDDPRSLQEVVSIVNNCAGDLDTLIDSLKTLDDKKLSFIALEVAREFAEFQDRAQLH